MTEDKRKEILRQFSIRVLDPLVDELRQIKGRFINASSSKFIAGTKHLIDGALDGFLDLLGVKNSKEVEDVLWARVVGYIISGLNAALPLDYPFVIATVVTKDTGKSYFIATDRSYLPGRHDILSPNFIPIFEADSMEAALRDELRLQRIITAEHQKEDDPIN